MTKEKIAQQIKEVTRVLEALHIDFVVKSWKVEHKTTNQIRKGRVIIINNYNKLDKNQKWFVRNSLDFSQHMGKYKSFWEESE